MKNLYWYHKWWTVPLTVAVLLLVLTAVPTTRYPLLGLFLKRQYSLTVVDATTHRPVSGATVSLSGQSAQTNSNGVATLTAKVGPGWVEVNKSYYKAAAQAAFVGVNRQQAPDGLELTATGRQVPFAVVDKISGKPVADATIKVLDTSGKTDKDGKAVIVLPVQRSSQDAAVEAASYNTDTFSVAVTDQADVAAAKNTLHITPVGRTYFLSNASGSIDVVSSNYDGSGRKTLTPATGNEDNATQLFVSPDQKYLALFGKRDAGKQAKLYVISTATGTPQLMDNAVAAFNPVGWAGDYFIYSDQRQDLSIWQTGQAELKSYSANDNNVTTLDKSTGEGSTNTNYAAESFNAMSLVDNTVLYAKTWSAGYDNTDGLTNHQNNVYRIQPTGKNRQGLRSITLIPGSHYSDMAAYIVKPELIYLQSNIDGTSVYFVFQNGGVNQSNTVTANDIAKSRPTYFLSPNGNTNMWYETRDGKAVFFTGDTNAGNPKTIATLAGYQSYGWNTDGYILVSKDNTLYVLPAGGRADGQAPLKVSDYFTPSLRP